MTLADIVFPFFLFIVGISIPLAMERAEVWEPRWGQLGHILIRSAGLLMLGVIELNSDKDRTLGPDVWGVLAAICVLPAWCVVPRAGGWKRSVLLGVKSLGILGMLVLLAISRHRTACRGGPVAGKRLELGLVANRLVGHPGLDWLGIPDRRTADAFAWQAA